MKNLAQPSPSPRLGGVCVTLSAVALVLFRSVSNAQQNEPRNVSVCQLVDSPKEFNGKYVRVRAQVSSDGIERTNLKELPSGFLKMLGRILTCPSWKTHCIGGVAREQWERRSTERSRDGLNGDLKKELLPDQWKLVAQDLAGQKAES